MTATIRRATPEDLRELLELIAEYCAADGHEFDLGLATAGVEPLLASDAHGVVLVAVDALERTAGYAVLGWGWSIECGGREAVLDELYVRSRGRGIGSALLQAAEGACRDHGVLRIFLETELPNEAARRLYLRNGFTIETSVWMSKVLSRPSSR